MDTHILKTFSNVKTYELHELSVGFHPLRQFYYNHRSLVKYWLLTRDLIAENLLANKDFFEVEEQADCLINLDDTSVETFVLDGEELENDFEEIPHMQKLLIICTGLTLVETCLMGLCSDLDEDYQLNGKGAYIQQYIRYLQKNSSIRIQKKLTTELLHFAQARNNFIHQFGAKSLSHDTVDYLKQIGGDFVSEKEELTNIHIDYFLTLLGRFGENTQQEYWAHFSTTTK